MPRCGGSCGNLQLALATATEFAINAARLLQGPGLVRSCTRGTSGLHACMCACVPKVLLPESKSCTRENASREGCVSKRAVCSVFRTLDGGANVPLREAGGSLN